MVDEVEAAACRYEGSWPELVCVTPFEGVVNSLQKHSSNSKLSWTVFLPLRRSSDISGVEYPRRGELMRLP